MQGMQRSMLRWLKIRTCVGFAVSLMVLSVLAGCATDGKVKPAPVVQEPQVAKGPSVERLADGREGFIIMEIPQMDEASRRDFDRAVAMLNDEEYGQAIDLLEKIIEKSPGVTAPYIDMAIAYRHIGKLEQAEDHLKTALHLVPEHPAACNEYGLLYRKTGRFAEARTIYENVIARFPDYYPVHRNLGILCDLYLNDLTCALDHYEIYSEAMPDDKQVKSWIADLRTRLGYN
ncbi:MAG: tetratricopeptide repeat protein [Desulfobacterales bacterium]